MQINREFNHKKFGHVGKVFLESDVTTIKLNGKPIPDSSIEYLLTFALQSLQDAYAGAKTEAEAKGGWEKKLDAIVNGTLGTRGTGTTVSEEQAVGRIVVRRKYKAQLSKEDYKKFNKLPVEDQLRKIDATLANNLAKLSQEIADEMNERKREKARLAGLAANVGLELTI